MDAKAAADALDILNTGRDRVRRQSRQQQAVTMGSTALLTVLGYARKDVTDPTTRRVLVGVYVLAIAGFTAWQVTQFKVHDLERGEEWRDKAKAGSERISEPSQDEETRAALADDPKVKERMAALRPRMIKSLGKAAAMVLTERLVVTGLRRSGLRRPNLAAGVVLAAGRTAYAWYELRTREQKASDEL